MAALQVIAASAGGAAARKGQRARAAEGGEDDVARWRRRKGFFQRFFRETLGAVEEEYKVWCMGCIQEGDGSARGPPMCN